MFTHYRLWGKNMSKDISKRTERVLNFIKDFTLTNNVTPTIREIGEGVGLKNPSAAYYHFKKLIKYGYIVPHGDNTVRYYVKGINYIDDEKGK